MLDVGDFKQYGGEGGLARYLAEDAAVVLISCSTAEGTQVYGPPKPNEFENLMDAVGALAERKVFAPEKPTALKGFVFDKDGRVIDVEWSEPVGKKFDFKSRIRLNLEGPI